jgi:glycosyltransferase involved in cell wall biosynthesis
LSSKIEVDTNIEEQERKSNSCAVNDRPQSIIVLVQYYLPGFKAGGPIRSIANLIDVLGQELKFSIVTSDRDIKDRLPYPGISTDRWMRVGNVDVMYISPGWHGLRRLISLLLSTPPTDVIYINSFFSRRFSMLPIFLRRMGFIKSHKVVVAPRGEFSEAALKLKSGRKRLYLALTRWLDLNRNLVFHASSTFEASDIRRIIKKTNDIQIAQVVSTSPGKVVQARSGEHCSSIASAKDLAHRKEVVGGRRSKVGGRLQAVFVSRICPMKNLFGALNMLKEIDGDIAFDIYGPAEDTRYWGACQEVITRLPSNIQVKYHGMVEHDRLPQVFARSELLFLPTLGENYGHVICEAMSAGCPVLISDRTPWKNLESQHAGWDVPLEDVARFQAILKECVEGDEARQNGLSIGARSFVGLRVMTTEVIEANRRLFQAPE